MPRQRVLKLNYFDLLLFVVDLFILLKASLLNKNPRQIEVTDFLAIQTEMYATAH